MSIDYPKARQFQKQANSIYLRFKTDNIWGIKVWYSHAQYFENGCVRAFVGINPGGSENSHSKSSLAQWLKWPYAREDYSAWLDEDVGSHHHSVQELFKLLYGSYWRRAIRKTASFNVAPFHTRKSKDLTTDIWQAATPWFRKVLQHIDPRLIICNGNAEHPGKSPWAIFIRSYGASLIREDKIAQGSGYSVKFGQIPHESAALGGTRILALPNLGQAGYVPEHSDFVKLKSQLRRFIAMNKRNFRYSINKFDKV